MIDEFTMAEAVALDAGLKRWDSGLAVRYLPAGEFPAGYEVWRDNAVLMHRRGSARTDWVDAAPAALATVVENLLSAYQPAPGFVEDAALLPQAPVRVDTLDWAAQAALGQHLCALKAAGQRPWRLIDGGALRWYLQYVLVGDHSAEFAPMVAVDRRLCLDWRRGASGTQAPAITFAAHDIEAAFADSAVARTTASVVEGVAVPAATPYVAGAGLVVYALAEGLRLVFTEPAALTQALGLPAIWAAYGWHFHPQASGGFALIAIEQKEELL